MQAGKQQQSWKIRIQARAQKFNFKLKATQILSTGKLHRFSLLLRVHNFILKLQLKSGSAVSISTQQKRTLSLKPTFFKPLAKLRPRPANKTFTIRHPDLRYCLNRLKQFAANKKSLCAGSLAIAISFFLLHSIYKKDLKGIIITHTSIVLICSILYLNRHIKRKISFLWIVLIAGTAVALHLGKGYIVEYAWSWRAWPWSYSYAAYYSGCWFAACQVIFAIVKIFSYISKLKKKVGLNV